MQSRSVGGAGRNWRNRCADCALRMLLTAVAFGVLSPLASAGLINDLVIFDASLSDTGNGFYLSGNPGAPYFNGRASDGPVWVEYLASLMGLPAPTPSLLGGKNYAVSGAALGAFWPDLGGQIDQYLSERTPNSNELFILRGGLNDFSDGERDPAVTVGKLAGHITTLAQAGAESFLVPNMPPIEFLPIPGLAGSPIQAEAAAFADGFNALLSPTLDNLETQLGITIVEADHDALFSDMIANPASYGLTNVTQPAFDVFSWSLVGDPNTSLWWDLVHPTTVVHSLLAADALLALQSEGFSAAQGPTVPEPSSLLLATASVAGVWLGGRHRRRCRRRTAECCRE